MKNCMNPLAISQDRFKEFVLLIYIIRVMDQSQERTNPNKYKIGLMPYYPALFFFHAMVTSPLRIFN